MTTERQTIDRDEAVYAFYSVNSSTGIDGSMFGGNATGDISIDNLTAISAATPLPPALPLFGASLGGLGLLGWQRSERRSPDSSNNTFK
jgi:hypothetical protein